MIIMICLAPHEASSGATPTSRRFQPGCPMSADNEVSKSEKAAPEATDLRRRAALAKLGRTTAYTVPFTISMVAMMRSARAS